MISSSAKRAFSAKIYPNYIGGKWVASKGAIFNNVMNPLDSKEILGQVPQTPKDEFDTIV